MTFLVSFLGSLTALLVVIATVWTYANHVLFPALLKYLVENRAQLEAAMAPTQPQSIDAMPTIRETRATTQSEASASFEMGMSYENIADILLTMTHTQRVTVLLLLSADERDEVLNACIRAHNDARNISRNDVTEDIAIDEAS